MDSFQMDDDPFVTGYKLSEHVPGYTGFIPRIQNSFAQTFTAATRVAMSCPPTPDIEATSYDFQSGMRHLTTPNPLPGTGFLGFVEEAESPEPAKRYMQGGPVNLTSYYEDQVRKVERVKTENPRMLTQKKSPVRNLSQVPMGDTYYYSGKHMFQTTTKESYKPSHEAMWESFDDLENTGTSQGSLNQSFSPQRTSSTPNRLRCRRSTGGEDGVDQDPIEYRYKTAQALVGKARIDSLHVQVADRVQAKVVSGNKDMIRTFNFFAKNEGGRGHGVIGHEQFLPIAQKLGVYMTAREAMALFGRYDFDFSGQLTYFEFIDRFFEQGERIVRDKDTDET
mmetsp:Transcript_37281/g.76410  ORF Transcript_37281/g.76410 Transcript_37281/m.76410 type:complete len:337 (-) Transcript_37281:108-1118(-)